MASQYRVQVNEIPRQVGVATNQHTVFLITVENDNFAVEEYPCAEFGVNDLDGCFSFCLKDQIFFCAEKNVFWFHSIKHKWVKLNTRMEVVRFGTRSVSLKDGTIVAGGCESDGKGIPELTDNCVLLKQDKNKLVTISLGKLPMKVKNHTMTKITDDSFIMCGGSNFRGHEANDAYFGTLDTAADGTWYVQWKKLPNLWEWRSSHFAMYTDERFYVFGGGPRRPERHHLKELNLKYCGFDMGLFAGSKAEVLGIRVQGDKVFCSKRFQPIHDMAYDVSFANLVLSPDEKYSVIAGGEMFGYGERKAEDTYLTMSTKHLIMKVLNEKDPNKEDDSLYTNNILKLILSCNCFTPMTDD